MHMPHAYCWTSYEACCSVCTTSMHAKVHRIWIWCCCLHSVNMCGIAIVIPKYSFMIGLWCTTIVLPTTSMLCNLPQWAATSPLTHNVGPMTVLNTKCEQWHMLNFIGLVSHCFVHDFSNIFGKLCQDRSQGSQQHEASQCHACSHMLTVAFTLAVVATCRLLTPQVADCMHRNTKHSKKNLHRWQRIMVTHSLCCMIPHPSAWGTHHHNVCARGTVKVILECLQRVPVVRQPLTCEPSCSMDYITLIALQLWFKQEWLRDIHRSKLSRTAWGWTSLPKTVPPMKT